MVRIKDDSRTHTKCLLDPFDEEANQLESAARSEDWEREIAIQLMVRGGLRADEVTCPPLTGYDGHLEATDSY